MKKDLSDPIFLTSILEEKEACEMKVETMSEEIDDINEQSSNP